MDYEATIEHVRSKELEGHYLGEEYILRLNKSMEHTGKHSAIENAAGVQINMHCFQGIQNGQYVYQIGCSGVIDCSGEDIADALNHYDLNFE